MLWPLYLQLNQNWKIEVYKFRSARTLDIGKGQR